MADNKYVKRVMTLKSGPFYFTALQEPGLLSKCLEVKMLYNAIDDLPILPKVASRLDEEAIVKSIFGTAALEGNPLSEEKVAELLSTPDDRQKRKRAEREIVNLKEAYKYISSFKPGGRPLALDEATIKKLHSIITSGVDYRDNVPGGYRNEAVRVGDAEHGGVYTPPKALDDIRNLMREFCDWLNSPEISEFPAEIRGCLAHYHLAIIHPFGNGNGRTARALEALVMQASGIKYMPVMLSNYYYRNIDDYYWAFSNTLNHKRHEITPMLDFALTGMKESLVIIKGKISYAIRKLTLGAFYEELRNKKEISQRQHDLLMLLLDKPSIFTLPDLATGDIFMVLYRRVSERTARRDLKKMEELRLLLVENGSYSLNLKLLG
jgi:Fic family protein